MIKQFENLKSLSWSFAKSDSITRVGLLKNLKLQIQAHEKQIVEALKEDFNKAPFETLLAEIYPVYKEIDFFASNLKGWMKPQKVSSPLILAGSKSHVRFSPRGCALILSPWNYPFQLAISPLIAAIGAGNTVILKPSELTVRTSQVIADIIASSSISKYVQVIQGGVEVANQLLDFPFDHIFFTGSTQVGKHIMKKASESLASVTLELGGKSPVILDESYDLEKAVESIIWGKFINSGQTCVAPDHIYIPQALESKFKILVRQTWSKYAEQFSRDSASIITDKHWERIRELLMELQDSTTAKVEILGGLDISKETRHHSLTIVTGDFTGSRVSQEEIFGPILPIKLYQNLEDVLSDIQSQEYPLALYIFSNRDSFIERILSETRSGGVCINDVVLHLANPHLPFGGVGTSGLGNYHGFYGFRAFSHERAIFEPSKLSQKFRFFYPPYTSKKFEILKKIIKAI